MRPPKYIYKILPSHPAPPIPLPLALPVSDLDRHDNFIHLSTSAQILKTLQRFFASEPAVHLLRIDYPRLVERRVVKWETGNGKERGEAGEEGFYPHLRDRLVVGREEVDSVGRWERPEAGWSKEGWPFGEVDVPVQHAS